MGFAKFDSRKVYFAENGTKIENATNAENAIELAGLNFEGGFLAEVAHGVQVGVAEKGVVVERDFGVHGLQREFALAGEDDAEGVDFDQRSVALPPGAIDALKQFGAVTDEFPPQAEGDGDFSGLVGH